MNIGTQDITINPIISSDEMHLGTRLGMNPHSNTSCVKKQAFIESIVEGMRVYSVPFDKIIGKLSDLLIVNAIYAHNNLDKFHTILLRINYVIYIKNMKHTLLQPNQAREYGNIIDDIHHHLDHTRTGTFTITYGDYDLPLEQYIPTAYIHLIHLPEE